MAFSKIDAFGKLERDGDGVLTDWHPLVDHLIDVTACFLRLCRCRSIRRSLEDAAGRELTDKDLDRLAVLVFLHDLGKANSGFQVKRFREGDAPKIWPGRAGHGKEAVELLTYLDDATFEPLLAQLPIDALCQWGEVVESLLLASFSHHGRPIALDPGEPNRAIWRTVIERSGECVYDPETVVADIGRRVETLLSRAFEPGGEPLPDAPCFGHVFAGLVQLADWLGSDTRFFPYTSAAEDRARTAPTYADRAVLALALDADEAGQRAHLQEIGFANIFGVMPYPAQSAMVDADLAPLVILESETGSGKTEAALWRYVHLFRAGLVDALYFALPTRVAATQVCKRVEQAATAIWPNDTPVVVRALPGYASAEGQEPEALPGFRVLWPDDPNDARAHRRWAAESPKRFLAAPIAVGTIDQALLAGLQVRHAHLRHALLARSLLVVDEVHASDAYMQVLLEGLLDAHLECGGHALLLSATLGSRARARYLGLTRNDGAQAPPGFEQACKTSYPAISDAKAHRTIPVTGRMKRVRWEAVDCIDDAYAVAALAIEAAGKGAKVLVVRNTVRAAIAMQQALEDLCEVPGWLFDLDGIKTLHHSRFSRQDRPLLDAAVEAQFGKRRPAGPKVLVGTQTLEQSLDLDADFLITDLCPMDVLLQRIGRLHRHDRDDERPVCFKTAQAKVLTPAGGDLTPLLTRMQHGLGPFRDGDGVYPDLRIIACTLEQIRERREVSIPRDNRYLVEAATHPDRLVEIERRGGACWTAHAQLIEGQTGARQALGNLQRLDFDLSFGSQLFDPKSEASTRLGVRDRLVLFDSAPAGPFGASLRQLALPYFLVEAGLDPDAMPEVTRAEPGRVEFRLGNRFYHYDRFGLQRSDPA